MKSINWNKMSELGLIERINREILHPVGLAISRNPETGFSEEIYVADDGIWEYHKDLKSSVLPQDELKARVSEIRDGL